VDTALERADAKESALRSVPCSSATSRGPAARKLSDATPWRRARAQGSGSQRATVRLTACTLGDIFCHRARPEGAARPTCTATGHIFEQQAFEPGLGVLSQSLCTRCIGRSSSWQEAAAPMPTRHRPARQCGRGPAPAASRPRTAAARRRPRAQSSSSSLSSSLSSSPSGRRGAQGRRQGWPPSSAWRPPCRAGAACACGGTAQQPTQVYGACMRTPTPGRLSPQRHLLAASASGGQRERRRARARRGSLRALYQCKQALRQ